MRKEESEMNATPIGLDIAKTVFQVHGVDRTGKTVQHKQLKRAQVLAFFANLPPPVIGLEACAGAHYWARERRLYCFSARVALGQSHPSMD
jgi:transposase